jgi:hypothetical protein
LLSKLHSSPLQHLKINHFRFLKINLMTALAHVALPPLMYVPTSRKVLSVVQTTKSVGEVYLNSQELGVKEIFKQPFLDEITQKIINLSKETEENFLHDEPFTPETYRDAREAHALLGQSIELLHFLNNAALNWHKFPLEVQPLVKGVKQLFTVLTKSYEHLSNRFVKMDAPSEALLQSKYLRQVTGAERWALRTSVHKYVV